MNDWNTPATWGATNLAIAISTLIIGVRLLIRAAREDHNTAARMIYGGMFLTISICCAVLSLYRWRYADAWPEAGLIALMLIAVTSWIAVIYLVAWKRPRDSGEGV